MSIPLLDALLLGAGAIRAKLGRAALSALGIAIGIATLVLVTAVPASGQRALSDHLTELGSNLLVAQSSNGGGDPLTFAPEAAAMTRRIGPVQTASAVANLHRGVQRTEHSDANRTTGITALAATGDLLESVNGSVASGRFLAPSGERLPVVVLGARAAEWLGIPDAADGTRQILVGDARFSVVGVLDPLPLTSELDQAVFLGWDAAQQAFGFDGRASVVYLTSDEAQLQDVRGVLPATLLPQTPGLVQVTRPSDVLAAKQAANATFSGLFLGLAAVALLVGGIGVANTMVVSVLERRRDIGLRRALGASRRAIRTQFLMESALLSAAGGVIGTAIGVAVSAAYALLQGWPLVIPIEVLAVGIAGSVSIGIVAGLYPAGRAAAVPPTQALA